MAAGGLVVSIIPPGEMPAADWPATVVIPSGMGDARNLLMALSGDACIVIGGRAGTISEVCLAWLHKRPLLPLVGHGGWSDALPSNPPDERKNSPILPVELHRGAGRPTTRAAAPEKPDDAAIGAGSQGLRACRGISRCPGSSIWNWDSRRSGAMNRPLRAADRWLSLPPAELLREGACRELHDASHG